jgi:hypothetical protein
MERAQEIAAAIGLPLTALALVDGAGDAPPDVIGLQGGRAMMLLIEDEAEVTCLIEYLERTAAPRFATIVEAVAYARAHP